VKTAVTSAGLAIVEYRYTRHDGIKWTLGHLAQGKKYGLREEDFLVGKKLVWLRNSGGWQGSSSREIVKRVEIRDGSFGLKNVMGTKE
jgi:hypothetical protein